MERVIIPARLKPRKDGTITVQCGHDDHAPLGTLVPSTALNAFLRGEPSDDGGDALAPPGRETPYSGWFLMAPGNPNVSAAIGFSRRVEPDGVVVYAIITPTPQRDEQRRVNRDVHGVTVPRISGRSRFPNEVPTWRATHALMGHFAAPPCVVECWQCERVNRVTDPGPEQRSQT